MKIKMLTLAAGPAGVYPVGSVVDLTPEIAQEMIRGGNAVALEVNKVAAEKVEPVVEKAEAEPAPERAVVNAAKGKNAGNKSGKNTGKGTGTRTGISTGTRRG